MLQVMRLRSRGVPGVCALALPLAVTALLAQPIRPPIQDETPAIFRSDTRLVVCHTTVMDKTGHLVTTLPREAFTVYENNVQIGRASCRERREQQRLGV